MNSDYLFKGHSENLDCAKKFRDAYENRYTWGPSFNGYKGECSYNNGNKEFKGEFVLGVDLKPHVTDIAQQDKRKTIESQLWEVAIHRVRRSFNDVHGKNSFHSGDTNDIGEEIIVDGRNKGDRYRIKDNIVTMVYRNIHGKLILIFTKEVFNTGKGYLSKRYTSQYLDPNSKEKITPLTHFDDSYVLLNDNGPWVLSRRFIQTESYKGKKGLDLTISFFNLENH